MGSHETKHQPVLIHVPLVECTTELCVASYHLSILPVYGIFFFESAAFVASWQKRNKNKKREVSGAVKASTPTNGPPATCPPRKYFVTKVALNSGLRGTGVSCGQPSMRQATSTAHLQHPSDTASNQSERIKTQRERMVA